MYKPKSVYTKLALDVIIEYVRNKETDIKISDDIPDELQTKQACFVSLHTTDDNLRGCIGTIEPVYENLFEEIKSNAIAASSRDSRFPPLTEDELDDIEISVDVLSLPEIVESTELLDPHKYGVIVSDGSYRRAVLLPNLEGIDTLDTQLSIVKRKAGLQHADNKDLIFKRFTSTRYH